MNSSYTRDKLISTRDKPDTCQYSISHLFNLLYKLGVWDTRSWYLNTERKEWHWEYFRE